MRALLLKGVLRAYPPRVRSERGEEMLGTALDLSCGSSWLFAREILAMVRGGVRARVRVTTAMGPRRLAGDVLAQAVTVWAILSLAETLRIITAGHWHASVEEEVYLGLLVMSVALALLGYDRLAGLCGLGWILDLLYMTRIPFSWSTGVYIASQPLESTIVRSLIPCLCYTAMILAPRSWPRDPRRLIWLVGPATIAMATSFDFGIGLETLILLVVLAGGLVLLPANPRLAIACVLVLSEVELSRWAIGARLFNGSLILSWVLASAPLIFAACAVRLYTARQ